MRLFLTLLRRDLSQLLLGGRRGGALLPVLFFLAVAMLFPFAVGPDAPVLARTGGGVIWVAALLAAILPLDRLIEPDIEQGFFDQWALRGISEEALIAVPNRCRGRISDYLKSLRQPAPRDASRV